MIDVLFLAVMDIDVDAEPFDNRSMLIAEWNGVDVHPTIFSIPPSEAVFCINSPLALDGISPFLHGR
jgi:hypothetical protein